MIRPYRRIVPRVRHEQLAPALQHPGLAEAHPGRGAPAQDQRAPPRPPVVTGQTQRQLRHAPSWDRQRLGLPAAAAAAPAALSLLSSFVPFSVWGYKGGVRGVLEGC